MTIPRVVVLDDWEHAAEESADWSHLRGRADLHFHHEHLDNPTAVIAAIASATVVVLMRERTPLTKEILDACPQLHLVVTTGVKNNAIDLAACHENNVLVCATEPGTGPVVELAWSMILSAVRQLPQAMSTMASGGWALTPAGELRGRTLGLLGLGRTGARMAAIAHGFGMNVVAWSPHLTGERAREHGALLLPKGEFFAAADIVSVHLVLSDRTEGIVGRDELALMRPTSWLINTSRGALVDEQALADACSSGQIAGAMVDVYSQEPLPATSPLRNIPNLLTTPHIGYVTAENFRAWFADVVEDIEAWLDERPIRILN